MTDRRAMELLAIERMCVRKGSGMEFDLNTNRYIQVDSECNRDCANCILVQNAGELLEMYDHILKLMIDKTNKKEDRNDDCRDWQRNCDPCQPMAI